MRKLAALTFLITAPAAGHQVRLNIPELLKVTGGDSHKAGRIEAACAASGKSIEECREIVGLTPTASNFQLEAAKKCSAQMVVPAFKPADDEIADKHGSSWHFDYRPDEKGKLHRHAYSPELIEAVVLQHQANTIENFKKVKSELDGLYKRTETKGWVDTLTTTIASMFGGSTSKDTKKGLEWTSPVLSLEEHRELVARAEAEARKDPGITGRDPNMTCYKHEKYCIGTPTPVLNASYEEPGAKKGADNDKKDETGTGGTKSASDSGNPQHDPLKSTDKKDNDNGEIKTRFVGAYAGDPPRVTKPGEAIVTSANPEDMGPSLLEECIKATSFIMQKVEGQKHRDDEQEKEKELKKAQAEADLANGICDESYFGQAFCHKYKQDLLKTEEADAEAKRQQAYDEAMAKFQSSGTCREEVLGWAFCKAAKDELDSHKVEADPSAPSNAGEFPNTNPIPDDGHTPPSVDTGVFGPLPPCEQDRFGNCKL